MNELKNHTYTTINHENNINTNGDVKQTATLKGRDLIQNKDKIQYLEYEVKKKTFFFN